MERDPHPFPSEPSRLERASAFVLALFVVVHGWLVAAATSGRESYVLRADGAAFRALATLAAVIVPFAWIAHLVGRVLALRTISRERRAGLGAQIVAGAIGLFFLLVHLRQVGGPTPDPFVAYETLRTELGRPFFVTVYSMGLAAFFVYLAQALADALPKSLRGRRFALVSVTAFAAVLWLASLQVFAYFSTGAPFFDASDSAAESTSRAP